MPAVHVVRLGLLVPTAEQTRCGIEFVFRVKDVGSVGVVEQILEVVLAHIAVGQVIHQARLDEVLDNVVVHATVERDVGAGTDGAPDVRLLGGTGVTRVDNDPLSALLMGLLKPQRADGWFSTEFEPQFKITSVFWKSHQWLVMEPRPNEAARPATVGPCQTRA